MSAVKVGYNALHVVNVDDLTTIACTEIGLVEIAGGEWTRLSTDIGTCHGIDMWANDTHVFVARTNGFVEIFADGTWETSDTGVFGDVYSIWGFSSDDVWAGTDSGQLANYDGENWNLVDTPVTDAILGMWGKDGDLFMHTANHLLQYDGIEVRTLGYLPPTIEIKAIWGNSATEVFLAVIDESHVTEDCGPEYLLWWDGSEFHWF